MGEKLIIFIRHGQSTSNKARILSSAIDKYPLTGLGRTQAEAASMELKGMDIDCIYSSPVLRAAQTARIVGRRLGMSPTTDKRLAERLQGRMEGRSVPDYPEWKFDPSYGIEPWSSLKVRMASFMKDADSGVVIAVSHGDPISAACDTIDGKGERFHTLTIPLNCRFTIIDYGRKRVMAKNSEKIPVQVMKRVKDVGVL